MKAKLARDEPLKIPLKFDDAIKRAVTVKPPPEGWAKHMKKLRRAQSIFWKRWAKLARYQI